MSIKSRALTFYNFVKLHIFQFKDMITTLEILFQILSYNFMCNYRDTINIILN